LELDFAHGSEQEFNSLKNKRLWLSIRLNNLTLIARKLELLPFRKAFLEQYGQIS
jgi:hypothetical protein